MAQVTSGTVRSDTQWYSTFYVSWNRTSYDVGKNESYISWEAGLITSNNVYWLTNAVKINSIYINGSLVLSNQTYSNISGNGTHKLASGTTTIKHNDDGNKSFGISISGWLYDTGSPSGSGTFELEQIDRYAICNQSLNSKAETTIIMNWSSDYKISKVWCSIDGGTTWKEMTLPNSTSGKYKISNLNPNTTYSIKTRVRRADNGLTSDSSTLSIATYDYPHCIESPNFTIGNKLTLSLYNPLGRSVTIQGIAKSDNTSIFSASNVTGTSVSGFNDSASVTAQYKSIPNAKNGAYKVVVSYGSITKTRDAGNTYSIKGTETPTIGTITYADTNTSVTAITGNNQHIVQNKSNLKVTYTSATAKNSASISKHTFTLNGVTKESTSSSGTVDFGVVNSANNLTLTIKVTDSRGLSTSSTKTITMLAYSNPNAKVILNRLNNYEDESYLTVDGSVSSVNNKNTMAIKYRYKVSGGSYGEYTTISDNVKQTLSLDKNNAYIFNVVVTDAFGSTYNKEYVLEKGVFPLFIDTEINAVGINDFPSEGEALKIKDGNFKLEKELNGSPRIQVSNGSVSASLHVGAGGVNRGIYDETDAKWIVYNDGKDVYLNSNLYPMAKGFNNEVKNTAIFDDVSESETFYRSGLYSVNDSTTWYNVINIRHRNGYSDGLDYGMQIRKPFSVNATMQIRSQNSKSWSGWEAIFRAKTLYDNSSGATGTITLNETSANFSYLEVFYKNNDSYYDSTKVCSPNGKKAVLSTLTMNNENGRTYFKTALITISNTSITFTSSGHGYNGESYLYQEGTYSPPSGSPIISIVKVVGYR